MRAWLDGDSAAPDVFAFLRRQGVEYIVAMGGNATLARLVEPPLREVRLASSASGASERVYGHAQYRVRSWSHARRVILKGEVSRYPGREPCDNPRYVMTNILADPRLVYHRIYAQRGDVENGLKELHHGIAFDRLSCSRLLANQARFLLYDAAFVLYQGSVSPPPAPTWRAQVGT